MEIIGVGCNNHNVLDAILTNDATKNILPRVLGDLGHEDLKLKVSQEIFYQGRG